MILTGEQVWRSDTYDFGPGWLEVSNGRVVAVHSGTNPDGEIVDGWLAPGFVDVHSHGGGGAAFTEGAAAAETVLATHLAHGTTTMIASLVTAGTDQLLDQIDALAPLVASGALAGVHLEGPWLSPKQRGAHDPGKLSDPLPEAVEAVTGLPSGLVRMVTIAPELPGALAAIAAFHECGIVAAIGHTAADFAAAEAGFAAGAAGVTHLFNAMPDLRKRDPGPVLAALVSNAWLEVVFDCHHVDATLLSLLANCYPERLVLITDAMAAAGMGDGDYTLGGLAVQVRGSVARLVEGGSIAGSTITLADAVVNAVASGVPLATAVRQATANPAAYLDIPDVGVIRPGARADFVELDADGGVRRVMRRGAWL
jgi:N-acetylglucosamine-6-phosphate deacetylase